MKFSVLDLGFTIAVITVSVKSLIQLQSATEVVLIQLKSKLTNKRQFYRDKGKNTRNTPFLIDLTYLLVITY